LGAQDKRGAFYRCAMVGIQSKSERFALTNQKANSAQTYVCCHKFRVDGIMMYVYDGQ
jgi:hypothetical protein